jgi:transcriptional regulator with XRE-family HTH domain
VAKSPKESDRQSTYRLVSELGSEKYVIERIREEMEKRGWSQAELSRRMELSKRCSGGVLTQGVLSKMLRGGQDGRGRHVSIEQLITLSKVFSVPLNELLVPASTLANIRGWRYYLESLDIAKDIRDLATLHRDRLADIRKLIETSPELSERIVDHARDVYRLRRSDFIEVIRNDLLHIEGSIPEEYLDRELMAYGLHRVPVVAVATELLDPAASTSEEALYRSAKALLLDDVPEEGERDE